MRCQRDDTRPSRCSKAIPFARTSMITERNVLWRRWLAWSYYNLHLLMLVTGNWRLDLNNQTCSAPGELGKSNTCDQLHFRWSINAIEWEIQVKMAPESDMISIWWKQLRAAADNSCFYSWSLGLGHIWTWHKNNGQLSCNVWFDGWLLPSL